MDYRPRPLLSNEPTEIVKWIRNELDTIARVLGASQTLFSLDPLHVAPMKPRDGMVVYADGTDWNPGGGAGVYARVAGAWVKL